MHALLISPTSKMPCIMSTLNHEYPTMIKAGYTILETGTKKELEPIYEEMMQEFANELEVNND